jgi:branched-chain amino acid transport system permease protein
VQLLLQQIINGISAGAVYAVVALGFGLVFSVMRVINLAHPDLFMIGAYSAYLVTSGRLGLGLHDPVSLLAVAILLAVAVTGALGLALERVVIRPLRGRSVLIPFIATAGVSIFLQNVVQRLFGADAVGVSPVISFHVFNVLGATFTANQLLVAGTAIVVLVVISGYVRFTKWGRATRAVAERPAIAASCGVNVNRVSQLAISLSAMSAGLAGVAIALLFRSADPTMGVTFGIKSFVCMLVAGNRNVEGIMAVGLALGITEALVAGYVSTNYRDVISFALMIGILVFRPRGIFGSYSA